MLGVTIKVHVITLCQLNELRERMLIVCRFQSRTTYFLAKKRPSLVFNFVVIFNWIFRCHLSGQEDFFVGFLRNVSILTSVWTIYTIERLSGHVIENLNIYEIQKQTCELSQITMLTSTKAEEMVKWIWSLLLSECFWVRVKWYMVMQIM